MQNQGFDCGKCIRVCTEGAASMVICHSGVTAKIKKVANKNLLSKHCIICGAHLAAQKLSPELNDVMARAVKIINYIFDRVLHLRLFEALCMSMAARNCHLIFYAEVIWLLRGSVLARFFEGRSKSIFSVIKHYSLKEFVADKMWISKLAYLADIFSRLNDLNHSLQGYCINIFTVWNKVMLSKKVIKKKYEKNLETSL